MSSDTDPPRPRLAAELLYRLLDGIVANGRQILLYGGLLLSYTVCIFFWDEAVEIVGDWWPILLGPVLGWWFADWSVRMFYRPTGRIIAVLDPEGHLFRAVFVPDSLFREFTQTGNNVVYHTAGGAPLYLAKAIDIPGRYVDYGWVHEADAMIVMTREEAYSKWDSKLTEVLEDNLELVHHPHVIGLGYARAAVKRNLDSIARAVGFDVPDYDGHPEVRDPRKRRYPTDAGTEDMPEGFVPEGYDEVYPPEDYGSGGRPEDEPGSEGYRGYAPGKEERP